MLTKEQAIKFFDDKKWEPMTPFQRAGFQLFQDCLCMPFKIFHEAMELVFKRKIEHQEYMYCVHNLRLEMLNIAACNIGEFSSLGAFQLGFEYGKYFGKEEAKNKK